MTHQRKQAAPPDSPSEIFLPKTQAGEAKLKRLGGSDSDLVNNLIVTATYYSTWTGSYSDRDKELVRQAAVLTLEGINPRSEVEGMLAAQMVATYNAAMDCFRRAMIPEQTFEGRNQNLNFANKLVRSYTTLMEALDRHRGKGQQKVTVEHVHVHKGGQAIVGHVEASGAPGGRGKLKVEEQSHEP